MKPTLPRPVLMLVTEPHPDLVDIVAAAVRGGVNVLQWRDKISSTSDAFDAVWDIGAITLENTVLLINGAQYLGMIRRVDAQGLHLSADEAQKWLTAFGEKSDRLTGCSVHTVNEAVFAAASGADYLVAGTVYASQSHPDIAPQGVEYLREVCASVRIPVVAIGGITPARVQECMAAGAAGVAVLSPIMRTADPEAVARDYWNALQS